MTTKTTTLSVRSPEDLLAAVPCVLGFHPAESLVTLTVLTDGSNPTDREGPRASRLTLPPDSNTFQVWTWTYRSGTL